MFSSSPGDYSFLLHQVEGDISDNISSRKRYRNNNNNNNNDDTNNSSFDIIDKSYRRRSSITSVNDSVKTDELLILIEKLEEQLKGSKDENERLKERSERQIIFLETENKQLKKLSEEKSEKYYDEKKKWQSKLRTLEADNNNLKQNEKKGSNNSNTNTINNNAIVNSNNDNNKQNNFMIDMENRIKEKCSEVKTLSIKNAELEQKIKKLEQDLLLSDANISTGGASNFEEVLEMREMTKKCSDLESNLRRKTRECERFEQQLNNQQLLKDEITALNSKLKATQVNSDKLKELESICQALSREKRQWVEVFQDIQGSNELEADNDKNSSIIASASTSKLNVTVGDVNPMSVLRTLSSTQKRCALLLKTQGELEATISEQRSKISKTLSSNRELENKHDDALFQIERLESRLALSQQQVRLYEGEVSSLRALLGSFDSEFKIGKPEDSVLIKSKDDLITTLRKELDDCRKLAKSYASDLEKTNKVTDKISSTSDTSDDLVQKNEELRLNAEKYKNDFLTLSQISGLDFVPQNTKILHLIKNPATNSLGKSTLSSLPKEQIKYLRSEIKKIRTDNATSSEQSDTRKDTLNTSTAFGGADSSKLNQRLKEMFKERIASFREAVYLLTGYKIDLYAATNGGYPRLRLRSMYAEDPDDSLLFQWRDNALELMETPFATKLDQKLFDYLSTCNSVPAFLSNITMDLFDNQTFMVPR